MASHCLLKLRIERWRGKISLFEIGVLGPQVGHYRTVPGVPAVPAIHCADGQQSSYLHPYDTGGLRPWPDTT